MPLVCILLDAVKVIAIVFCVICGVVMFNGCGIGDASLIDPMSPDAFMAWLFSAAVAIVAHALSRRFRTVRLAGICRVCNYDLRATPERCPECGTIPVAATPDARNSADGA